MLLYLMVCAKTDCKHYKGNVKQEDRCQLACIHNIPYCKNYYESNEEEETIKLLIRTTDNFERPKDVSVSGIKDVNVKEFSDYEFSIFSEIIVAVPRDQKLDLEKFLVHISQYKQEGESK